MNVRTIRSVLLFLGVGMAFLALFVPYIALKSIQFACCGLDDNQVVNRLGRKALDDLFGEDSK